MNEYFLCYIRKPGFQFQNSRPGPGFTTYFTNTLSKRTVQLHLHKNGFVRRVAKKKVVSREVNRKKRLSWCREKRKLSVDNYWKKIIFSDESKIVVGQDSRIYTCIWRKRGEGWRPDLVEARRAKPCFAVMIWGCITWHGVGTITAVEGIAADL